MAPKGNQNAVGNQGGRPTKYRPEYGPMMVEYFESAELVRMETRKTIVNGKRTEKEVEVLNDPPLFETFAHKLDVCDDIFIEWAKVHPEFSDYFRKSKRLQRAFFIRSGYLGYQNNNQSVFIHIAKNVTDLVDKTVQDVNHRGLADIAAEMEAERDHGNQS